MTNRNNLHGSSARNPDTINPRQTDPVKPGAYVAAPLHPSVTAKQRAQIALGEGLGGHATSAALVGAHNPLDAVAPLKGVHLQVGNVPNGVGMRNRSGE